MVLTKELFFDDPTIWKGLIQFGIIMSILLLANIIRRKVLFIRRTLLPTAVIGGLIILLLRLIPTFNKFLDINFLKIITYHTLGLGFIALALKIKPKKTESTSVIIDTGAITVSSYVIQGIVGLGITLLLSLTIMPSLFASSGLLLPLGFGQGPGQAFNMGNTYEVNFNFIGGGDFGLAIAGMGFLVACIGGVIYLNYLKHKGKIQLSNDNKDDHFVSEVETSSPDEIPLTESIDKFTIQTAFVLFVYLLTYIFMYYLTMLFEKQGSIYNLLWGFNFLFGTIIATIVGIIIKQLKKRNIMTRQYPNNFLLNRIGGFMFDLMVIASIGAIEIGNISTIIIPFILICIVGTIVTFIYLIYICPRVYPNYKYEAFFSLFAMLTGTASTGMIMLREVDSNFETPAANNLVLLNFPAMIFGFPLLLLLPYAPKGTLQALITLGILIVMFILFNIWILRNKRFVKKVANN